jgi:hypothetical protein
MFKLLLCALLANSAVCAKDKPAMIFESPFKPGYSEKNYKKAIDALLKDNYEAALKSYEVMHIRDQVAFLGELFRTKKPDNKFSADVLTQLKNNVQIIPAVVVVPESWQYALGMKKLKFIAASDVKSQQAAASAATAVGVVAAQATGKESAAETIQLVGSDGEKILISKALATNPLKLSLIAAALDGEPDTKEVSVPGVTAATLNLLIPLLDALGDVTKAYKDLTAEQKKVVVERVGNIMQKVSPNIQLDDMWRVISAANYLGSPDIYHGLIWVAAGYLKRAALSPLNSDWKELLNKFSLFQLPLREFLPELATDYFLIFDEDIDRLLGIKKVSIPFETLKAYERFPKKLLDAFPNLGKDPNALLEVSFLQRRTKALIPFLQGKVTALMVASVYRYLCESGGKVMRCLPDGKEIRALSRLSGIDIDKAGSDGKNALQVVSSARSGQILKALLDVGANPEVKDAHGRTVLASVVREISVAKDEKSDDPQSALFMVNALIRAGANVNARDDAGRPVLLLAMMGHQASKATSDAIMRALIKAGADVNGYDKYGQTLWAYAGEAGWDQIKDSLKKLFQEFGVKEVDRVDVSK